MRTYKICVIGPSGLGKTTFVNSLLGSEQTNTFPTLGVEVHPLRMRSNYGDFCFNIWDCAGPGPREGLSAGYYLEANGFLLFVDPSKPAELEQSYQPLRDQFLPVVAVLAKADLPLTLAEKKTIGSTLLKHQLPHCSFARHQINIFEPLRLLISKLIHRDDLEFL